VKESEIERKVCEYAKKLGCYVRKFSSPGHRGVPDRLLITPCGTVFFIEFKTPTGKLSELQKDEIAQINRRGLRVYVIDSVDQGIEVLTIVCRGES
jgi:hypothetical protein